MKVIFMSLILTSGISLQACFTCYHYDQQTTHVGQSESENSDTQPSCPSPEEQLDATENT